MAWYSGHAVTMQHASLSCSAVIQLSIRPTLAKSARLMAKGMTNAEIAEELFVSETTVKTHVGRVLMKLTLRDRVQAVIFTYETGVVSHG